jgi:pyruvate kinase
MLLVTLPPAHKVGLIRTMFSHPLVGGARYNVAVRTPYKPLDVLRYLNNVAKDYNKQLWIDLKGRQLRIKKWADPTYGDIELSHEFEVDIPAKIIFRGSDCCNIISVDGNKIIVDPEPKHALGAGQAVNVIGNNLNIKGSYLTERDREYIEAAKELDIHNYMLSFVESLDDSVEVMQMDQDCKLILKIETPKGLDHIREYDYFKKTVNLMAARDDLTINIGDDKSKIIEALDLIVEKDPDAIVASHIFSSLQYAGRLLASDFTDLLMLRSMGYKNFMLSDDVSQRFFNEAIKAWEGFRKKYQ